MHRFIKSTCAAIAIAGLTASPALADSGSGSPTFTQRFTPEEAATYSKDIEKTLAAKGARVAIVFRTGRTRDKLPDGIQYTHGGFWVYQPIEREDGTRLNGYVGYNLFHGDGDELPKTKSYLATDFPFEFVGASAVEDVAVIIPTPEMQRRIFTMMTNGDYEAMHDPDYSLIASPFDDKFQNCNEFLLDIIAAAAWETTDYGQIKTNLKAHFKPTKVKVGLLGRLFGPVADERLKTSDHRGKPIRTVTYASLSRFMMENGLADESLILTPQLAGITQLAQN